MKIVRLTMAILLCLSLLLRCSAFKLMSADLRGPYFLHSFNFRCTVPLDRSLTSSRGAFSDHGGQSLKSQRFVHVPQRLSCYCQPGLRCALWLGSGRTQLAWLIVPLILTMFLNSVSICNFINATKAQHTFHPPSISPSSLSKV
jgi:hypothetical protein